MLIQAALSKSRGGSGRVGQVSLWNTRNNRVILSDSWHLNGTTSQTDRLVLSVHVRKFHIPVPNHVQRHHLDRLPTPLQRPRLPFPIHTRDDRPIIWPLPAYIKLVYAPLGGLWRQFLRERPSCLIHEAGSPLIQLLFNLGGGTIFSHVKVTATPPSASAVTRNYPPHPPPAEVTPGVRWGSMLSWKQLKTKVDHEQQMRGHRRLPIGWLIGRTSHLSIIHVSH